MIILLYLIWKILADEYIYYIDAENGSNENKNNCTLENPCKTFSYAFKLNLDGNKYIFASGKYTDNFVDIDGLI
jgi:hypothetical protein